MSGVTKNYDIDHRDSKQFLKVLGQRVRGERCTRGMTRKILARDSGVSERYLAQLEIGRGNVSILVLRRIAGAMALSLDMLLPDSSSDRELRREAVKLLDRISDTSLEEAVTWLRSINIAQDKAMRIGLIGLRGAGKSTLGKGLAKHFEIPFIQLNQVIKADYGSSLDDFFSLGGRLAYQRYELGCLQQILQETESAVIVTGGSIVRNDIAFRTLLNRTHTIWIKTSPEEHMARVIAQGDLRLISNKSEAMRDIRKFLTSRESSYSRALYNLDTSGQCIEQSLLQLTNLVQSLKDSLDYSNQYEL